MPPHALPNALRRRVAALEKRMDEITELLKTLATKEDLKASLARQMQELATELYAEADHVMGQLDKVNRKGFADGANDPQSKIEYRTGRRFERKTTGDD